MILSEARFNNEGRVKPRTPPPASGVAIVPAGTCRVDYEIEGNVWTRPT